MQSTLYLRRANRLLTPGEVLKTVRSDPGMTVAYYANRYFGQEHAIHVNHILWSELKRHGKVLVDRSDGPEAAPRWHPTFEAPRQHSVRYHKAEDEDLSVLKKSPPAPTAPAAPAAAPPPPVAEGVTVLLETTVIGLVQREPGHTIQYYLGCLPEEMQADAPSVFRKLREVGLLTRTETPDGFVWS